MRIIVAIAAVLVLAIPSAYSCNDLFMPPDPLVIAALNGDQDAVARLVAAGRAGNDAVHHARTTLAEQYPEATWTELARVTGHAIGALESRLYWHTDLAHAQQAAAPWQLPILHLRLLGRLDEELSCANSRFFRAILYSDPAISARLRERFVLCWTSERPVPRLTIDFGDGRVVDTTITGNSAHYVQDAEGRLLDALPGLVTPRHFAEWLDRVGTLHGALANAPERDVALVTWHQERIRSLAAQRQEAMRAVGITAEHLERIEAAIGHPALDAGHLAMTKRRVETAVLHAAMRETRATDDQEVWLPIANRLGIDDTLAPEAEVLVRGARDGRSRLDAAAMGNFRRDLRGDTARNGWRFHATIHQWLVENPGLDFDRLNRRIYAELFLTPATDRWLGLDPHATVSGLVDGGLRPPLTPVAVDTSALLPALR